MKPYQLFIDGRWVSADTFPTINPYDLKEWALVPQASEANIEDAFAAARRAYTTVWQNYTGLQRGTLLTKLGDALEAEADSLAVQETTDNGKVIRETSRQVRFAARLYRFYGGYADKISGRLAPTDDIEVLNYVERRPLGVVLLITAWNSPLGLLANKLAAALAAGNCVVIKPSEHASVTTLEFCRLIEKVGFPPGVVNVVTGDARVGSRLTTMPGFDKISFTGSTQVGREVAAAAGRNLTAVTLELGGKSANIIFSDADLERATTGALAGIFAAAGQTCVAGSRLLVQKPIYNAIIEKIATRAKAIRLGNPLDGATEMGPVATEAQFNRILKSIQTGRDDGARLVIGGEAARGEFGPGYFILPTIFADVHNDMAHAQEEIFGPVLSVIPFDDEDEAIAIANDTRFGLAAGVWTSDVGRSIRVPRAMNTGSVWVNTYRASACQTPSGGVKESGFGRERGEEGLLDFSTTKNVMVNFSESARDPFQMKL